MTCPVRSSSRNPTHREQEELCNPHAPLLALLRAKFGDVLSCKISLVRLGLWAGATMPP